MLRELLFDALTNLQKEIHAHYKMNVKKDFSLMVADAQAGTAIAVARIVSDATLRFPPSLMETLEAVEESMQRLNLHVSEREKAIAVAEVASVVSGWTDQTPLRYWAVAGRIPGDDEDTLHVFHVASRQEAIDAFDKAIWENEKDPEVCRDSIFKEHGQTVFVNSIVASAAPIEVA